MVGQKEVLNYIDRASQSRKKSDGKKEVSTAQMAHAALTFKASMETAIIEREEIVQHITSIQEICKKENCTKEEIEFLIEFLTLKCDFSASRIIQTKSGSLFGTGIALLSFMFANTDLAITVNNYRYWILVLKQVMKEL
jgi:hypothetical protein